MEYQMKKLSSEDGRDIYEMLQQIPDGENAFRNPMYGASYEKYKRWLAKCADDAKKDSLNAEEDSEFDDGWGVPKTIFWLYADDKPVGMGKVRHYLTEDLLRDGGHIGYAIREGERGKGHGNVLLELLLQNIDDLNIDRLLLTIEPHNEASRRIAFANGGVLEKTENGYDYIWIDL